MNDQPENERLDKGVHSLKERLDVYLSGRSGVKFEALTRFASPLFDLYDLDWRSVNGSADVRHRDELSVMVAVLDTARLLWSFFLLEAGSGPQALPELEDALLGKHAGHDDRSNVLVLLRLMGDQWQQFSPAERALAEDTPGFTLPPFMNLIEEYTDDLDSSSIDPPDRFGRGGLELPEALAIFAQPLLEDFDVNEDPDAFDLRIARAQAYWDLAITPATEYEAVLRRILEAFAESPSERITIRAEARRMVTRFQELFPERPEGEK